MNLQPFTFNGGTLHNGTTLLAKVQTEGQLIPDVDIIEVDRTNNFPEYAGKEFKSKLIPIYVHMPSGAGTLVDAVNKILDTTDTAERVFVCKDILNGNKQWYVNAVVQRQIDFGPNHAEYVLYTADPIWKAVDGGSVLFSGTSSPGTVLGTVSGNRKTQPVISITPGNAKTGSYAYKRFIEITNPTTTAYTAYPVNITDDGSGTAVWNSGTLVTGGTISSAAGNDVRVLVDNTEVGRWFGDFNTGTTKVWANVDLKPKAPLTLNAALGTTTPGSIVFKNTTANNTNIKKYPSSGVIIGPPIAGTANHITANGSMANATALIQPYDGLVGVFPTAGVAYWDAEQIIYSDTANGTLTITTRGANNTTAGTHADDSIIYSPTNEYIAYSNIEVKSRHISGITRGVYGSVIGTIALGGTINRLEHEAWLVYGNAASVAPEQDDNLQPAIDASTSNNIYHDWNTFGELDGQRTLSWKPSIISSRGKESYTYGGNQGTVETDPFDEAGMSAQGYLVGARWQSESCDLRWSLYHPAGGTQVIYSGEQYKATTTFPTYHRLRKSNDGSNWTTVYNTTAPATAGSWTSFAGTTSLGGTYKHHQWQLSGGMSALASASAYLEVSDYALNIATANAPKVVLRDQQPNYNLDMTITNTTTGESMTLNYVMEVDHTLTIDCVNKTVKYDNDLSALSALSVDSNRDNWMNFDPGVNTITITETGLTEMAVSITWEETSL